MIFIRDNSGSIRSKSANLRGIREAVGKHIVREISIDHIGDSTEGKLCVLFDNGDSCEANFASYEVLRGFVRRWRNVYGSPLWCNGDNVGLVSFYNPALLDK